MPRRVLYGLAALLALFAVLMTATALYLFHRPQLPRPSEAYPPDAPALVEELHARGCRCRSQVDVSPKDGGGYETLPGGVLLVEESTSAAVHAERDDVVHSHPRGFDDPPLAAGPWKLYGDGAFARRLKACLEVKP